MGNKSKKTRNCNYAMLVKKAEKNPEEFCRKETKFGSNCILKCSCYNKVKCRAENVDKRKMSVRVFFVTGQ